jgi:hypothetical protein
MAKETDFSNAIYELEKTLTCPSCGKIKDLQTHVECGAAKCALCWRQHPKCPCCQKSVDEKNTWDLGHILALNADRADIKPDGPVDAFLFLKALRDYNEASKENHDDDAVDKPKANDLSATKDTNSPKEEEKLVDRNSFGGKAFYGGDQSGKANTTGRIGRRRLERRRQQESPPQKQQEDSFDDSMFDFHSQSSMPASQVSMVASQTSSMPAPHDGTEESLQQHDKPKSGDVESPRTSQCSQRQQESLVESNHSTKDESESQQEKETEAADDAVQHAQDQSHSSTSVSQEGTMATSREESGALEDAQMDDSVGHSQQADEQQESQQGDNFDSQETRLESSSGPAETANFMDVDTTDSDIPSTKVSSKPSRRRVTIQSPAIQEDTSETKSLTSTRKANYRSVVTPASSSRKRQRTESSLEKSPIDEESKVGVDDLQARLDASTGETTSAHRDNASGEGDNDAEHDTRGETCFVTPAARKTGTRGTESQETSQSNHSIDSTVLPSTLDLNRVVPPQSVLVTMEEPCSQSSMPHSSPSSNDVEGDTNIGSSVGLDHRKAVETKSLVLGGGGDETMLGAGHESASKEQLDDDMHISEETQQTVLPSQELPSTCDFLRSFASSSTKVTTASDGACELSLKEKGAVMGEARDSNQSKMASTEVCVTSTSKAVASNPDQSGEKEGKSEDGNIVRGASHGHGNTEIAGGSSSLATPVIRPGSTVDSQESFNSQILPSSIDFRNDLHYLMPPPSASQSARSDDESKIQFSNTVLMTGRTSEEPTLGGLLDAQSSSPVNDDESNTAAVYEPSLRKDDESTNEKESNGKDDDGPIDHQLRKDSIATASLDSDNQRVDKRRELLPSPPDSQDTMVSSQHMPNTCDFLRAFVPPVAPTTAESDRREHSSLQTMGDAHSVAPSDGERTMNPLVTCGANSNLVGKGEGKTQKDKSVNFETVEAPVTADTASHDEETISSGPTLCETPIVQKRPVREGSSTGCSIHSDLSQRSRGHSDTTCLDESQNSLASCMLPATQELGGLFLSRQLGKTLPSVAPVTTVSFATSNVSNVTRSSEKITHGDTGEFVCRQGDTTVRSGRPNNAKVAMDPTVDSSQLHNSERVTTDTQQTVLQSQNLPSINDFCALFPSAVSVDERKETSGGLPLGAPQNKVEQSPTAPMMLPNKDALRK